MLTGPVTLLAVGLRDDAGGRARPPGWVRRHRVPVIEGRQGVDDEATTLPSLRGSAPVGLHLADLLEAAIRRFGGADEV